MGGVADERAYQRLTVVVFVDPGYQRAVELEIAGVNGGYLTQAGVAGAHVVDDRQALVGALVGYATHVGSLLVAEGIETPSELSALIELGVPLVQGFYLGRPAAPWPQVAVGQLATPV